MSDQSKMREARREASECWCDPEDLAEAVARRIAVWMRRAEFYQIRCELLEHWQNRMRDPERRIVCDILANGRTMYDPDGTRYGKATDDE